MKKVIILIFVLIFLLADVLIYKMNLINNALNLDETFNVNDYYNEFVTTNKQANLYIKNNGEFLKIGYISANVYLRLTSIDDKYFKINNEVNDFYVSYEDVSICDEIVNDNRYNNYIVFNKNIVTNEPANFYDEDGNLLYYIEDSFNLPLYVDNENFYGVLYNDSLVYIKNEDIKEIVDTNNTDLSNTKGISVLNYHFIFTDNDECDQMLCVSDAMFSEHLQYIIDNGFFTPTMNELEMYIDGKIQLPKSVVITADDGWLGGNYKELLEKYKLNGTLFLVTDWYDAKDFKSDYMEVHSHGNNIHNTGVCPGGQGGAIKCLDYDSLYADLITSRDKIGDTTVFAYPFYEYNKYSIEVLKDAGFTMAFGGEVENGYEYIVPGIDKFKLPRWVIVDYTDMDTFSKYLNLR